MESDNQYERIISSSYDGRVDFSVLHKFSCEMLKYTIYFAMKFIFLLICLLDVLHSVRHITNPFGFGGGGGGQILYILYVHIHVNTSRYCVYNRFFAL